MVESKDSNNDVYSVCTKSFEKIHGEVNRTTPQFMQSFTTLQQEYFGIWKNTVQSVLETQQKFASKFGMSFEAPETTTKTLNQATDGIVKSIAINNKIVDTFIDATTQNIKTLNENANAITELNQNIINSWTNA